jgi:hypothetical protein
MFILAPMMHKHMMFNKTLLLPILLLCWSFAAGAQRCWSVAPGFSYGLTPSYNVSSSQGRSMGFMWRGGARAAYFFTEHIGIGGGLELSRYDYDMRYNKPGLLLHVQRQSYIEMPLFLTWTQRLQAPKGFRPVLSVTAGIMWSRLTGTYFRDDYDGYTVSGDNTRDFCLSPAKALLYAGAGQHVWKNGDLTLGLEFTSLFRDNISDHPSVVKFLPGSLAAIALRMGFNIWLKG